MSPGPNEKFLLLLFYFFSIKMPDQQKVWPYIVFFIFFYFFFLYITGSVTASLLRKYARCKYAAEREPLCN